MPTLEIAVDARGVATGLEQANRALDETAKKADRAEKEVKEMGQSGHEAGRNMSAAFAATGGGLAITHGIEGMANGLRSGSSAMTAFAASQALLDLGRFVEDMRGVTDATGQATTVFGTLGNVIRAHPLMTIAAVLAGAAATMSLFADETEDAADAMTQLADGMEKVRVSREASELLGISTLSATQGRQSQLRTIAETFTARARQGQGMTYGGLAGALQLPISELLRLQQVGGAGLPTGEALRFVRPELRGRYSLETHGRFFQTEDIPMAEQQVGREAAQAILRILYRQVSQEITTATAKGRPTAGAGFDIFAIGQPGGAFAAGGTVYPAGFGTGAALMRQQGMPGTFGFEQAAGAGGLGLPFGMGFGMQAGMQSMALMQQYGREQVEAAKLAMDELIAQGQEFGQTIGDAFFRVAEGTMTARQAMAELVRQFAQLAAQSAFRGIGGAVAGAFAPTQTQNLANVGGVQPGLTGGTPGG